MDNSERKDSSQCVQVAVNIRPLVTAELLVGSTDCVTVVPGEPQVQIGSHAFTFDYVFGSTGYPSSRIFEECVAPLVDALFLGYNGTVLAYGQTGSGKTYTMGTNYNGEEHNGGVIPKVMETIFSRVELGKGSTEFLLRVSFIEIFKEEVFDLLDTNPQAFCKGDGSSLAKPVGFARCPIQIRETVNGCITLVGVTEAEVRTKEEMASFLLRGSLARATGSTNMNAQSSRSHAIFTISMEQKKNASFPSGDMHDDVGDDILCAKLHLVDLAGSERAKRTGADGMRFREGIQINKGLLALGNVISALGDEKKRKEGGHVPYRDSKLTRLLQDSLGGNSKTVMIACVSPADTNAEESLNTLKYANRARNILNKAIINRDPATAQMQRMRSQIEQLQAELVYYRGDASAPFEELEILKHKVSLLQASNADLQRELEERQITCEHLAQCAIDAKVEKDRLVMNIESARNDNSWDAIELKSNEDCDLLKTYVAKIQELEGELLHLRTLNSTNHKDLIHHLDLDDGALPSKDLYFTSPHEFSNVSNAKLLDIRGKIEDEEKELEHSSLQEKLDRELDELDRKLQQKEAEMKRFTSVDTSILKQHYEKKVHELEQEKRSLQGEIEDLRHNLANISSTSDDSAQKLKEGYLKKLNVLEAQVAELKKKQDAQSQLLRQKQKSDEAAKRLQDEIQRINTQKVQLQHKIKQESEQFRSWKASREKEVLQLKKEGRRNEFEMHKLLALNQRQKMVLHRKTEEAAMVTKRLKELLESRKASLRETSSGAGNSSGPGIQALMQAIEHELEVTVRVHEVRSEYERQMEERARMAKEVAELKEEAQLIKQTNLGKCSHKMSPGARNSRIFALENMLATSSTTIVSMASQLSEAEEQERAFSGRGRWNQVRSLAEAKKIMTYLFNIASSSRCSLRDKEVDCREKDSEIRDLKEKVVSLITQLEMQKAELVRLEKLQKLTPKEMSAQNTLNSRASMANNEANGYALRKKGSRSSIFLNNGKSVDLLDDMDTSESEHSSDNDNGSKQYELITNQPRLKRRNSKYETCCSCGNQSSCKTMRCECRAVGGYCGMSCSCQALKCSNREVALINESNHFLPSKPDDVSDETERNRSLVSHGAMLLQNALSEKPAETNDDSELKRKPLSDIANTTVVKSNVRRKKWRRSVIQLVPAPPPSSEPENTETPSIPECSMVEADMPSKLPRAMRSAASNSSNPLRERNYEQQDTSVVNKEGGPPAPRSPLRQARKLEDKENQGL